MNTLRNSVQLIGYLGADPEVKTTQNGNKVASLRIATTERYLSGGVWKESTQWHHLTMWKALAERAGNTLCKGSFVMVEGKLTHHKYTDAGGQTRYSTGVEVSNFINMDKRQKGQAFQS